MQQAHPEQRRANVFEIVGAWLHIWTPPRDAHVPPIPWRKLAIGAAIGALAVGIAVAILAPRIDANKERTAAANRAAKQRAVALNRARITKAQAPHHASAAALLPPAGASAAERAAAREQLMRDVEGSIFNDAKARVATGEMKPVTGPTTCERTPGTPTGEVGVFDCFIVSSRIPAGQRNPAGAMGYPFRAVVDYKDFTYNWCKMEQVPGEMLVLAPDDVTQLPAACQSPKA